VFKYVYLVFMSGANWPSWPSTKSVTHLLHAWSQVREISNQVAPEPFRWTAEALLALQEVRVALDVATTAAAAATTTTASTRVDVGVKKEGAIGVICQAAWQIKSCSCQALTVLLV
jgi:hypothetical protein